MKRSRLVLLILVFIFAPAHADAAVFARDWKTPGDGLLTYDDVNQREWLDLSQTRLSLFEGDNLLQRYQDVLSELNAGGEFEGFTVAKGADVLALAESGGVDPSTDDYGINGIPVGRMVDLLGPTIVFANGRTWSRGFADEFPSSVSKIPLIATLDLALPGGFPSQGRASLQFAASTDIATRDSFGVMLYRPVPEPGALALVTSAAVACQICRRARK